MKSIRFVYFAKTECSTRLFFPKNKKSNEINITYYKTLHFTHVDQLLSHEKETLIRQYPYRIHPTTDDRPFSSNLCVSNKFPIDIFHSGKTSLLDIGYVLIILTFVQIVLIAAIFILLLYHSGHGRVGTKMGVDVFQRFGVGIHVPGDGIHSTLTFISRTHLCCLCHSWYFALYFRIGKLLFR